MMGKEPKVSVLMLAYNQAKYIDEAIGSVMAQDLDFSFELIIGDDCSSDNTLEHCRAWQQRHPDKIVIHENEHNIGLAANYIATYQLARGKYIAICEGDDYWTDKNKLRTQTAFMEDHPGYSMCFHRVINYYEADGSMSLSNGGQKKEVSLEDIALCNPITNVAVFYRRGLFGELPSWMNEVTSYDFVMHMLNAQFGPVFYMAKPMAVYRKLGTSIWTGGDKERRAFISRKNRDLLITYFEERNTRVCNILRRANARNCIDMMNWYQQQNDVEKVSAYRKMILEYMPAWTDEDILNEAITVRNEMQPPLRTKAMLSKIRRHLSRWLPKPQPAQIKTTPH